MIENNRSKEKAARYAVVYNKILKLIQDGLYPEGSKLPNEPTLAEQMGVSRMTLRQALSLLQEDGIIESRRGIGNFVRKTLDKNNVGLERMENPIYKCCLDPLNAIDVELIPGISTKYTERILKRKVPVVLALHRYYKDGDIVKGYCFSHIATDSDCLHTVDLNNDDELINFMETGIYEYAHSSVLELRVVKETALLKDRKIENNSNVFQMIMETIIDVNGDIIAHNKYYIPVERAVLKVYRSK
ncbi:GntR family transcriptional regulator [Viridibacillus arvi]|uniref:GntR family transcriptional regulator n=1 Tax=Viridibacillus arvi TaxID=263475 RepID=UPI00187BBC50|nr:winged helix-turn-helix domain-containing protein [Viridibacillus sp. JNUCC-6]QOV12259.1 winged helix-turn-helix transcriptional regulator [Viridibacillus sp. JNUCC-6]